MEGFPPSLLFISLPIFHIANEDSDSVRQTARKAASLPRTMLYRPAKPEPHLCQNLENSLRAFCSVTRVKSQLITALLKEVCNTQTHNMN